MVLPQTQKVAIHPKGTSSLALLHERVRQIKTFAPRQSSSRWVLACEDPFYALSALWALGSAKQTIILPPNHQSQTLTQFQAEILDDARWLDITDQASPETSPVPELKELDFQLEFWTSGSTGHPKQINKQFSQLLLEVELLEKAFGPLSGPGPVLSTVSHTHIYGFLFRLLWPFLTSRSILTQGCQDPLALKSALQKHPGAILIASPAHLSRLPELLDVNALPLPRCIFSSGGPLAKMDAEKWPAPLVEIYGSTESGGIAHRQPKLDENWTPFPDYALSQDPDGALCLEGPRASLPDGASKLRMEDGVEFLPSGQFRLQDRLDRVIKFFEKRISLPQMEKALEQHPQISQAHVLLLETPRKMLGAALVVKGSFEEKALIQELKEHLAQTFEASTLPKRWRFLQEMPVNARGKRDEGRIREVLERPQQSQNALPAYTLLESTASKVRLTFQLPENHGAFEGHFPDFPLLPGILQVDWALRFAKAHWPFPGEFHALRALKFKGFIRPGDTLVLSLERTQTPLELHFRYQKDDVDMSSGRVCFKP